jgi:hypothetical protein
MFNAIKKLLGVVTPEKSEPLVLEKEQLVEPPKPKKDVTPKEKIEKAKVKTEPVTVKAKKEVAPKVKKETRKSLEKLTKKQIDDLAQERLGVELDRRKTKEKMIEDFMSSQKKAK